MDLGMHALADQGRPLVGALATANDQDAPCAQVLEARQRARVGVARRIQRAHDLFGDIGEVGHPRSGDHVVGHDQRAVRQPCLEAVVAGVELVDQRRANVQPVRVAEPLAVLDEPFHGIGSRTFSSRSRERRKARKV